MALIRELYRSRSAEHGLKESTASYVYQVKINEITEDEATVKSLLLSTSPATYLGMSRRHLNYEPQGNGVFDCRVDYRKEWTKSGWKFSTRGEKSRVYSGTHIRSSVAAGAIPIDFKGQINVTTRGVEGTEVTIPSFSFSINKRFDVGVITEDYLDDLFVCTGAMNNASVTLVTTNGWTKTFLARELLFDGVEGEQADEVQAELQYYFIASRKATNVPVPGLDPVEIKDGWDIMWVYTQEVEDETSRNIIRRPIQADVVRVMREFDFSLLGL